MPTDHVLYVGPGTYVEQLVIETANLTLVGIPASTTVPGAGWNAPALDGATIAGTTTGITIKVEGVTVSGFIIQKYGTAIYQPVVVGKNSISVNNNTIQNNGDGIVILSDKGAPGTNVYYNVFLNNSRHDLSNGGPDDNNVQYTNITNNYWRCPNGLIVVYKKDYSKETGAFSDWAYGIRPLRKLVAM